MSRTLAVYAYSAQKSACVSYLSSVQSAHFPDFFVYVVVDIAGFQEKVSVGDKLHIPLQQAKEGDLLTFGTVLMVSKDGDVSIGTPSVDGASVEVRVVKHGRDPKIRVFKHKRRKRYMRLKGHRQGFTEIEVTGIKA
jgi:large subunit ribosomal protein L21